VDFVAAYGDALALAKTVHAGRVWDGHVASLAGAHQGCPDFYAGAPDDAAVDVGDGAAGASWYDECETSGGVGYHGVEYWEGDVVIDGDATTPEGATVDATRTLQGNGVVDGASGVDFEFQGEATDAINEVEAKGYSHWSWSSTVTGTLTGAGVFTGDDAAPGGWRTDLAMSVTGGDVQQLDLAGNVFLFDHLLQDRFDSVELDLELLGEGALGPDDCALEPRGWIGLRDEDAYWYDVVFLPRYADTTDTGAADPDYSSCDGCGTIYVRGVQADAIGQVCLDFSSVWTDAPLEPPDPADFVLSLHSLVSEAP
jgi:hypothetical protein